jgi:4-hydroxy-3-methylbut-2-en-1-yl diphosphate reductase
MSVVVLAPLWIEAVALRGLDVRRTGMGARSADTSGADAVAIAGVCGAVDPGLRAGDVVLATELRSEDGVRDCPDSADLREPLARLGVRARTGAVWSAGRILGPKERARLGNVLAVDMESYWLAESAGDRPVVVVRVVVDEAGGRLLHPRTLVAGVRALRALRRTRGALQEWETRVAPHEPLRFALGRVS